jgi:FlgD Ig-like domain
MKAPRSSISTFVTLSVTIALALLSSGTARAAWPHNPYGGNVPLSTAASDQTSPIAVSDGAGGALVAWTDFRNGNWDIYAQRVTAAGAIAPGWPANGVSLCAAAGHQTAPVIASDGAGGAIVTWEDARNADIYAQRVSAAGVPQWTTDGVIVCGAAQGEYAPAIVADGAGGAFITWQDGRNGADYNIYAQRVSAAGVMQWTPDGVAVCTAVADQKSPVIVTDGAGGAIINWTDLRNGFSPLIFMQRLNAAGVMQWAANGVQHDLVETNDTNPAAVSDGAGGEWCAYVQTGSNYSSIHAVRMGPAGTPVYGNIVFSTDVSLGHYAQPPVVASDGAGGVIICWSDNRNGTDQDMHVVGISASMTWAWAGGANIPIAVLPGDQKSPTIVGDGVGGAIIAWMDYGRVSGDTDPDIYAQHVAANGVVQWATNGVPLCGIAGIAQAFPVVVSDGAGGAIAAWQDQRNGTFDIYAQRVERFGYLGSPEPSSAGVHDTPNDQGGHVKFSWYPSYLDQNSDPNLTSYDVYRSAPGSIAAAAVRAGAHRLSSFAELPTSGERAFVVDPASSQLYAWEYLATFNAAHFPTAYGYVAPTTSDSVGGSNPPTAFIVVGRNSDGSKYWVSAPDSGYSVDNIPPLAPAPFTGQFSAGTATLHWKPNVEPDFDHYNLYRGSSASFTPAPANLVVSQPDTGYADLAGNTYYYKLAAVDVHGNRSGFTTLLPVGTLGVEGTVAVEFALGPAEPNPAVNGARFRFALPREAQVTLTLYDEQGRRVRELAGGSMSAGPHSVSWDGRDQAGRTAPSGIYFCRLEADGRAINRRLAVIH